MTQTGDTRNSRSFVYVSDLKLRDFLDQIGGSRRQGILADLKVSVGVHIPPFTVGAEKTVGRAKQGDAASKRERGQAIRVAVAETHIRRQFEVGDPASGQRWIAGCVDMDWAQLSDGETVLFCGYQGSRLVALSAPAVHVRDWTPFGDPGGSPYRTVRSATLNGDDPAGLGSDLARIAREVCVSPQPVRFLAEVKSRGLLPESSGQREYVIATPLYIETVYAEGDGGTRGRPLVPGDPGEIDGYRLLRRLGEGFMGIVYLAEGKDDNGGRVAVKVIRRELADDPEFRARFTEEADNARRVQDRNVARVIAADVTDTGQPYLVTEFVNGLTLEERVDRHGRLTVPDAAAISEGIASGLAAIHQAGIVHRDLAPSNVILSAAGPKIVDFGIARALDSAVHRTQAGRPVAYMSPEQVDGSELTAASDVFSLAGVTVFAMTGHLPFGIRDTKLTVLQQGIRYGLPNLDGIPRPMHSVLSAALAKEPAQRPTVARLQQSLYPLGCGRSDRRISRFLTGSAACAYSAIAIAAVVTVPGPPAALVASGATLATTLSLPSGFIVQDVAFSRHGDVIGAVGYSSTSKKGNAYLWNMDHAKWPPTVFVAPDGRFYPVEIEFSPTSDGFAVADGNGVDLWNLDTGRVRTISDADSNYGKGIVTSPRPNGDYIYTVAYTPNGKTLVEANGAGNVYQLNVASGQLAPVGIKDGIHGQHDITHIAVDPDPAVNVATFSDYKNGNGHVYLWNLNGKSILHDLDDNAEAGSETDTSAFSPDGKALAVPDGNGTTLWSMATAARTPIKILVRPHSSPDSAPAVVAFAPNGATLAVGDLNGHIDLWNPATQQVTTVIHSPVRSWGGLSFSPDGKTLAVFDSNRNKIYLYHVTYTRP